MDGTLGGVAYEFRIGKYEITAAQYAKFLNAVAGTDTYGLYNADMTAANGCQIQRFGESGSHYTVGMNHGDKSVNKISWGYAARFISSCLTKKDN